MKGFSYFDLRAVEDRAFDVTGWSTTLEDVLQMNAPINRKHSAYVKSVVTAIVEQADLDADLVIAFLELMGNTPNRAKFSKPVWMELAAVARIYMWERQGLLQSISHIPSFASAMGDLRSRLSQGPVAFIGENSTPLFDLVFATCLEHFAWDAPTFLGAQVVCDAAELNSMARELASFFWENRATLAQQLGTEDGQ